MEKDNSLNQKTNETAHQPVKKDASTEPISPKNLDFIPIIDQPLFVQTILPPQQSIIYRRAPVSRIIIFEQPASPNYLRFNYIRK